MVGGTQLEQGQSGRRRRSDAERNIRAIVDAAIEVLLSQPRASMQEIAAAAGVHRATVHRHFATRDDLLRAIREQSLDEYAAVVSDPELGRLDPGSSVAVLTRRALDLGDRSRVYRITPIFDDISDARQEILAAPTVALMARARQVGALRRDMTPKELSAAWTGLVLAGLAQMAHGALLDDVVGFVLKTLSPASDASTWPEPHREADARTARVSRAAGGALR